MLHIKLNNIPYAIPTNWGEVTMKQYIASLDEADGIGVAKIYTGIPNIESLPDEATEAIFTALSFAEGMNPPTASNHHALQMKVADLSYLKMEMAKAAIINAEKPYHAILRITQIYRGFDYSEVNVLHAYPICFHFFNEVLQFQQRFKRLGEYKPNEIESITDSERLKAFGSLRTMNHLADRIHKTISEVGALRAGEVYKKLLIDLEEADYRVRYEHNKRDVERSRRQ